MKECNFLQTYEIFLKLMYLSLLKEFYNPNGTLKAKIDRNGNKTEYEYDCMNQLTRESVSDLIEKTYTYDSLGRKVSENDKENNLREYNYDNLGRVIKEISPEGIELSYTYDARGNVTEYIDGRKTKFVREYTKTDLLKSEKAFAVRENNDYEAEPAVTRSYKYDEGGILEEITEKIKNQEEESKLTYNEKGGSYQSDAYGNIRSMKWSSTGLEMSYEYDNLNRMSSVITPDGKEVAYTYNMNNQVTSLTGYINESITYSKAKISEYTLLNGIKKSFEYNDLGGTSSLKYNKDSKISTGFSYTYDDNFNIETRTSLDTKKLSSFEYDAANRLTNSYMEGEFESKTAEQLTTNNFSYINRDLVGAKQELVKYEVLPEEIIFDTSARSYVYKFSGTKEIRAIELYPENKVHRVRERDVHIYVKENTEGSWQEVRNWKFNKDEKNGALKFTLKEAVRAGYVKVRSSWDDRNKENVCIDDYSTFKGKPNNLLRIWTLENTLTEEYSYDGNSNRISFVENGNLSSYEYYKNKQGGNTAKVKYDGKWYYTYDSNGNRTEKAKALISGVADKSKEYWTYEWDLWNRLVKVVQYNAPDNGECVEVSYEYDALNHRISRTTDSETTKYAYGRNGALAYQEKTKDGSVTKRSFAYLNNEIVGFTDKAGGEEAVYYTVTDIQGSITEVYDGSSNLVWKSGYTAFGQLAGEVVDLIDFDGMYTGCDYDSVTGLTYHWNRWRSEDGSAFISEDPARDGTNWYGYAGQNPMVYVDPTGEFAVNILVGAATGFISSAVINTACQIAFGVMQGQSVTESIKNIDVSSVMISGLGGAVTGAITGGMSSVKAVKDAMTMYKTVNGAVNVAANVAGTTVSTVTNNAIKGEKLDKNISKNIGLSAVAGVVSGALSPGATKVKDGVKESFVKMSTIGKSEKISIIKDVKMDNSIREIVVNVGQELIGNMVE